MLQCCHATLGVFVCILYFSCNALQAYFRLLGVFHVLCGMRAVACAACVPFQMPVTDIMFQEIEISQYLTSNKMHGLMILLGWFPHHGFFICSLYKWLPRYIQEGKRREAMLPASLSRTAADLGETKCAMLGWKFSGIILYILERQMMPPRKTKIKYEQRKPDKSPKVSEGCRRSLKAVEHSPRLVCGMISLLGNQM